MGEVHHGNTVTDFMAQERERGIMNALFFLLIIKANIIFCVINLCSLYNNYT